MKDKKTWKVGGRFFFKESTLCKVSHAFLLIGVFFVACLIVFILSLRQNVSNEFFS